MFRIKIALLLLLSTGVFLFQLSSCEPSPQEQQIIQGGQLARQYCSSCHLSPDPSLLDQQTWSAGVLPAMAVKLGINRWSGTYYKRKGRPAGISVSIDEWNAIVAYYMAKSPVALSFPEPEFPLQNDWSGFSLHLPPADTSGNAATTMVSIDTLSHSIFTADAISLQLRQWNSGLRLQKSIKTKTPVVNALYTRGKGSPKETMLLTSIGSLAPTERSNGTLENIVLDDKADTSFKQVTGGLRRPVQTLAADFNKDGLTDYVVCGFGHRAGSLDLLTAQKDGSYLRSIIRKVPGSEQAITGDFNHDGWPDLMVLFAQADEGIWMFLNDHHGGFTTRKLLGFPSVWGSTSFQLVDFNHDGKPDILYTCGDNADYSPILKPYHGIYIFTNTGDFNFSQTWFYHINGCTKAVAADFRHSGNLDIAAIAFFADFKMKPEEAFVYLRQDKPMQFSGHAVPVAKYGRYLCMTVGDYDNDGDPDIVLGSFSIPDMMPGKTAAKNKTAYPFLVLENKQLSEK